MFIISISCIGLGCLFGVNASLFQRNNEMSPFTSKETNLPINQSNCWSRGSVPEWVTQYSFEQPKHSFRSIEGNEILLHSSIQIDIESETTYYHGVTQIANEMGAQKYSYFSLTFDPQYEKVVLHKFHIWRDGSLIDLLETADFEVIQREQDLSNYIYNGQLSLITFLEDIKVGDILEVSYSIQGKNPILSGKFIDSSYLQDAVPVDHHVYRLLIPEGRKINFKNHGINHSPVITTLDSGKKEWVWELKNTAPVKMEENIPSWFVEAPYVQLSEFESWEDCISWAKDLFKLPEGHTPELNNLINDIKEKNHNEEDRALQALRYVQDKIRYLGIEAGLGSHQPSQPDDVFKRGYGDCKDKVLLLHAILDNMGIESYPALVHTHFQNHISNCLPSPGVFNHAILAIRIKGKFYWVDPTLALEGGPLSSRSCSRYGKALMINPNSKGLSSIDYTETTPNVEVTTTYEVSDYSLRTQLTVQTVFYGNLADAIRSTIQQVGQDKFLNICLDEYAQKFGDVQPSSPPTYHDNRQKNEIVVVEKYMIQNPWELSNDRRLKSLLLYPSSIVAYLKTPVNPNRNYPLAVTYPLHIKERVEVKGTTLGKISDFRKNFQDDSMSCVIRGRAYNNKFLSIEYDLISHKDHVVVNDISRHHAMLTKLKREIFTSFTTPVRR